MNEFIEKRADLERWRELRTDKGRKKERTQQLLSTELSTLQICCLCSRWLILFSSFSHVLYTQTKSRRWKFVGLFQIYNHVREWMMSLMTNSGLKSTRTQLWTIKKKLRNVKGKTLMYALLYLYLMCYLQVSKCSFLKLVLFTNKCIVGNPVKGKGGKPRCCLCVNDFISRACHMTPVWRLRTICPLVAMRVTAGRRSPGPHTNPFTHSYWETEHTAVLQDMPNTPISLFIFCLVFNLRWFYWCMNNLFLFIKFKLWLGL